MGWYSGPQPPPPLGPPPPGAPAPPSPEFRRAASPTAWVPPTSRLLPETTARGRQDAVLFVLAGTGYLVFVVLIVAVAGLQGLIASSVLPTNVLDLRVLLAELGWFGFTLSGLVLYFLTAVVGIPYRPPFLARLHLLLANVGLVGYAIVLLAVGDGPAAEGFLFLAGASYLMFSIPLLLALLLGLEDWLSGAV